MIVTVQSFFAPTGGRYGEHRGRYAEDWGRCAEDRGSIPPPPKWQQWDQQQWLHGKQKLPKAQISQQTLILCQFSFW